MTFNPYSDLPTWLNEGLAMYAEGKLEPELVDILSNAAAKGTLISVRSLSSPFSAYAKESSLAYAQSYSLVKFLINRYGQAKMFKLLSTFKSGSGYDAALTRVYGFDMDGLNTRWQDYIGALPAPPVEKKGVPAVLVGALVALFIGLLIWLGLVIRGWTRQKIR